MKAKFTGTGCENLIQGKTYEVDFYKKGYLLVKNVCGSVLCAEKHFERDEYSVREAAMHASIFCKKNPKWVRIVDVAEPGILFDGVDIITEDMWEDLAVMKCKVLTGFITGKGTFCKKFSKVNKKHSFMQVFRIHKGGCYDSKDSERIPT